MKHILTILTYVPQDAPPDVRRRLPEALRTLDATDYDGPVALVDDGSTDAEHVDYLQSLARSRHVVFRGRNGGISRAKNTCLRVLREFDFEVGFLAEDDIAFLPGWHAAYLEAHRRTTCRHFCWVSDRFFRGLKKTPREIEGFAVVEPSRLNGVFLTCTPEVLDRVGGFRPLPFAWGHEHLHWTERIVRAGLAPFACDVVDSNRVLGMNRFAATSTVPQATKLEWGRGNAAAAGDFSRLHWPLVE